MQNLRTIRKSRGLTMKQLGELVGVTESAIGMYETGKREPSLEVLLKLGDVLSCQISDIIGATSDDMALRLEDDLATDLQLLRDRPELRALLHVGAKNTPSQVKKLTDLMMSMNGE